MYVCTYARMYVRTYVQYISQGHISAHILYSTYHKDTVVYTYCTVHITRTP